MARSPAGRQKKAAIGGELVIPLLAVAYTVYFFVSVRELSWEAKANAVTVGVALLALVAVQLARTAFAFFSGRASLAVGGLIEPRDILGQRVALVAVAALFVFLIPWLGLTLGLFILTGALMLILRAGSFRMIALASAAVSIGAYLLFIALLNSRMPRGPLEKLLAGLW